MNALTILKRATMLIEAKEAGKFIQQDSRQMWERGYDSGEPSVGFYADDQGDAILSEGLGEIEFYLTDAQDESPICFVVDIDTGAIDQRG